MFGRDLPAGQMSFLFRAGSGTLDLLKKMASEGQLQLPPPAFHREIFYLELEGGVAHSHTVLPANQKYLLFLGEVMYIIQH